MNSRIEKALLLLGSVLGNNSTVETCREFYEICDSLMEDAIENPKQFTGAELVLIQVALKTARDAIEKHPSFELLQGSAA